MHDDLLEQRLRSALRTDADTLPFTITADELQRRVTVRRRGRLGRSSTVLLAAAIGVALVGVGVVAGSFLDRRDPAQTPLPSTLVTEASAPTPRPTPTASSPAVATTQPAILPPMNAFLAALDPARIVRAEAIGPDTAPLAWSRELGGPGSTTFAALTASGTYRVVVACLGAERLAVRTVASQGSTFVNDIPVVCDGSTLDFGLDFDAGQAVALDATVPTSWRFALLAPARPAPHAETIAADVSKLAGRRLYDQAASSILTPVYDSPDRRPTEPSVVMGLTVRDAFRIAVTCAGPGPMTYELRPPSGVTPTVGERAALGNVAIAVECDGRAHLDVVHFPFATGTDLWIEAPNGTAWRMAAAFEDPPITSPKDEKAWTLGVGMGPNLSFDPIEDEGVVTIPTSNRVRVVVTCFGGTGVDILIRDEDSGVETTGSAGCQTAEKRITVIPVEAPGRRFKISTISHGPMWLAVTLQQATLGSDG
jgi:hypothetical protein